MSSSPIAVFAVALSGCVWMGDGIGGWGVDNADLGDVRSIQVNLHRRSAPVQSAPLSDAMICPVVETTVACQTTNAVGDVRLSGFATDHDEGLRIDEPWSFPTVVAFRTDDHVLGGYEVPAPSVIAAYSEKLRLALQPDTGLLAVATLHKGEPTTETRVSVGGQAPVMSDGANHMFANLAQGTVDVSVDQGQCRALHAWSAGQPNHFTAPIYSGTLSIIALDCN